MIRVRPNRLKTPTLALALCLLAACGGAGGIPSAELPSPPTAEPLSTPIWYVISDAGGGGGGNDRLFSVDITLSPPQNGQSAIGAGTGTNNIEGAAFWPGTNKLYAFDSGRLGTVSLTTGVWTQVVNNDVWDDGNNAALNGLDKNRNAESISRTLLNDIDSVSFDPNTGVSYGVARTAGADILFTFSPATGRIIRGAFTIGANTYDYFRVPPVEPGNEDIDDIAIDPYDGQLYGIANGGGLSDRLVRIDKFTGVSSDIGLLGVDDMEGFAFYNDSSMWGSTGSSSNNAANGSSNSNSIFSINRVTGEAYGRRPLTAGGADFESVAFLTADLNNFCGRVWCDLDGNGVQTAGELGAAGVTVVLWRDIANNDVLDAGTDVALVSTVTDAQGDYCFGVASTGDYVITLKTDTLPANWILSHPNVREVSVTGFGNAVNGLDFIKVGALGTLGDTIFLDADGNGTQDIEDPGLRNVTVRLVDPGADATCGTADDILLQSTTTDGGGYYVFAGLPDGAYCLDVDESTLPPLAVLTTGNEPYGTMVIASSNDLNGDFGYRYPGRIGDLVWIDLDGDGIFDAGEPGLAGVGLTLRRPGPDGYLGTADDVVVTTTTSAGDGSYEFSNLTPGAYSITADDTDAPAGATRSTFANPIRLFLAQGQWFRDADFGYAGNASIGDRVWNDVDGDGVQDAGEPGIAGVTVTLLGAGPDGSFGTSDDQVFPPQTTSATGAYNFTGLPTGTYRLDVDDTTLPAGLGTPTTANDPLDVLLGAGVVYVDGDFGYKTDDASIGDRVWDDLDGDGVEDVGEPGLAGITLRLLAKGPDGLFGTADDVILATQATAGDGSYDFGSLAAGDYRVDVDETTLAVGRVLTTGTEPLDVSLAASEDFNDADFGYWIPASIGDRVWNDLDGDGLQDPGEPGLAGVDLRLTEAGPDATHGTADDVFIRAATTAADGSYSFSNLGPGAYRVDVQDGSLAVGSVSTTGNDPLDLTLNAGGAITTADFGYWQPASVGDRIWNDLDGDGTQDGGEPGLAGVTLELLVPGSDGILGTPDDGVWGSAVSAADGSYGFASLPAGSYRVDIDQTTAPVGYALTTGNDPLDVTLVAGENLTTADFGFWISSTIGDRVWNDLDGDGVQDAGEPGLVGVLVDLAEAGVDGLFGTADDVPYPSQATGLDGVYTFSNLPPGTYRVDIADATVPAGMTLTTGNDPRTVVLSPGQVVDDVDVGYRHAGRIGDLVYDDVNGNGVQDPGEPGLVGVSVLIAEAGPDGICGTADDTTLTPTSTGAGGDYRFEGLAGGTYCVLVDGTTIPVGFVPSSGAGTQTIVLAPGQDYTDADFAYRQVGAIGDRVWQDVNENGVQDPGEPGIAGVTVNLLGAGPDGTLGTADDLTFTPQVTAADGSYLFPTLFTADYRVSVDAGTVPAGMQLTSGNEPFDVTLPPGGGVSTADFGYQHAGRIGDLVWHDLDESGTLDGGEPGLDGVGVELLGAGPDDTFGTADDLAFVPIATAGGGLYAFTRLAPGTYRVSIVTPTLPSGMQSTTSNMPLIVSLGAAEQRLTADFGYQYAGHIGDLVYLDLDANGVRDGGEAGIGGVTVDLSEAGPDGLHGTADDVLLTPTTTAGDGTYGFARLPPGLYRVAVDAGTLPAGLALTTANLPYDLTLVAAQVVTDADFGYRHTGSIGDFVWQDLDQDGLQDAGEPGLDGATVRLFTPGVDGLPGTADDVLRATDTTAAGGSYGFPNLPAGAYRVVVDGSTLAPGLQLTTGNQPRDLTLAAGETLADADFGYQFTGSIGDRVWRDVDFDGVQDGGEAGLNGVTVELTDAGPDGIFNTADDVALATAVTAGDGAYAFGTLPPGTYRVTVDTGTLPAGVQLTTANLPRDVVLGAGQVVTNADFGFEAVGSIGDRVWNDTDGDGIQDPGEAGLDGVTLTVTEAGLDGLLGTADDVAMGSVVTAGDGAYDVTGLPPGLYRVDVVEATLPAGVALSGGPEPRDVTLAPGQDVNDADFGYTATGLVVIGDVIWVDSDADGLYEPTMGERPLPGVTVTLRDPQGTLVATGSTNQDGEYRFTVPAGEYTVEVDTPNFATGGPLEGMTSTGAGTSATAVITSDNFDLDFGFRGVGSDMRQYCQWWSTNTSQWPLQTVYVGGQPLSQAQALTILNQGNMLQASLLGRSAGRANALADVSVLVAWALIGAKLNVAGGNDYSSIEATILAADAWLQTVGIASGIRQGHAQYTRGRELYQILNAWNAGY